MAGGINRPEIQAIISEFVSGGHDGTFGANADRPFNFTYLLRCRSFPIHFVGASYGLIGERLLMQHSERKSKDAEAFILGTVRDGRNDENVVDIYALGYDIDGKMSVEDIQQRVSALGIEVVLYTTYNHLKTETTVGINKYRRWARHHGYGEEPALTDASMQAFCAADKKYNHLKNVRVLDGGKTIRVQKDDGEYDAFKIGHDPEHKTRVIIFLKTPIPVREIGIDAYKAIYHYVGRQLFGGTYDTSCENPARLHYRPSHPPGASGYVTKHFPGDLLDWKRSYARIKDEINRNRKRSAKRRADWELHPPRALVELHHVLRSIPSDIPRDEWFRALAALFHETRGSEDGRELAHSWSARDYDEYSSDEVDGIWDGFDLDYRKRPATMATLLKLAAQYDKDFKKLCRPKAARIDWNYI